MDEGVKLSVCRGNRSILQACQGALLRVDAQSTEVTAGGCPAGNPDDPNAAYLDMQCSKGYSGPLCSICSAGFGVSGHHLLSQALW